MNRRESFRQRYKYWKETGELPYSNGLKRDLSNQALSEDSPVKSGIPYPKYDGGKDGLFIKYVDSYRVNPDTGGVYDKVGEVKEGAVILPEVEVVGKPTGIEAMRREYNRISDIQRRQGLSGADPIGQFVVETAALNPVFKLAGTAGLYGLGRYGESLTGFARPQNWARGKLITREMDKSPFGSIGSPVLSPQVRTRVGDVEIDNPNLLYHLDRGDGAGAYSNRGAYVEDGFLFPGTPKAPSDTPYSWWNKGKPYATSVKGQPMTRLMTATKDTPGMIHIRSQNYPIGQWNGKSGFVLPSEYVNPEEVNVSGSTYTLDPNYGWRKMFEGTPTAKWSVGRTTPQITAENATVANAQDINISPEELYKALQEQEGYYFMGHGTGRTNVDPEVIFNNGLRIKNGDIANTTSPLSESNLVTWPHANSKEVIILPARAENTMFDSAYGRIPSDWYDANTFQWIDDPGFEGSGLFAVQKPNASFMETVVNGVPGVYTKPSAILGSYNTDTHVLRLNPNSQYKFPFSANTAPEITAENAASITPEQWTAAQDAAIARGDMAEAQRLRDLHFVVKTPNNVVVKDGMPTHNYHGTDVNFNEFDIRKFGRTDNGDRGMGFYFSENPKISGTYGPIIQDDYLYAKTPYKGYNSNEWYLGRGLSKQQVIDELIEREIRYRDNKVKSFIEQQKGLKGKSRAYEELGITENTPKEEIEKLVFENYNTDNMIPHLVGNLEEADVFLSPYENVVYKPNQIKSAEAVTYDDKGVRIPLGSRDNFKLNDIRYGLLPFLGLGTTGSLYGTFNRRR